jgi:hypothetical protein
MHRRNQDCIDFRIILVSGEQTVEILGGLGCETLIFVGIQIRLRDRENLLSNANDQRRITVSQDLRHCQPRNLPTVNV